ncbi:MAG: glyoxylase family protein [Petroclostridium sp.]|uniref:VOC family protein n=1 Tax=Petroclostridium xylanilyticum TaxID=1792311 RepID=UPI0012FFB841|nr:VOC family protein [Petroclostridium xylanilyticum]MDK2809622.1 glyoxylase family protein [Petroclostridium sp.]
MIKGIEHVAIFAKDTAALKDWYIKMFEFRVVYDNGKGTYFLMAPDGAMIEFVKTGENGGVVGDKVSGIRHLALSVDNFEEMVDKLLAEKVEVVSEPAVSAAGIKTFFFRDPEGNVLHLIYRPQPLA